MDTHIVKKISNTSFYQIWAHIARTKIVNDLHTLNMDMHTNKIKTMFNTSIKQR